MKKYYFIFAVAMAFLAACDNEDNVVSNDPTPNESQNITYIRAEANEGAMTRGSVDDEATFTWNEGG